MVVAVLGVCSFSFLRSCFLSFLFFVLFCSVLFWVFWLLRTALGAKVSSGAVCLKLQALATSATSRRRICCRRIHGGARIISRATCVFLLRRLNTCCLLTYEQPWGLLPYSKNRHAKLITSRLKRYHKRYHRPDSYHTLQLSFSECY